MRILLTIILASMASYVTQAQCSPNARALEMERNIKNHGDTGWDTFYSTRQAIDNNVPKTIGFNAEPGYYYEAFVSFGYSCEGVLRITNGVDQIIGNTKEFATMGPSLAFQVSISGSYELDFNVISKDKSNHCVIVSINRKRI